MTLVVWKFYLVQYQISMTREIFRVRPDKGRHWFYPSGHLRIIYQNLLEVINSSSKAEHGWESRRYNLPKALCIRERTHKVINYEGHYRIIIQQWIWRSTTGLMWVSVLNQKKKNARRSEDRNNWLIQSLIAKELWIPCQGIRSNALIRNG